MRISAALLSLVVLLTASSASVLSIDRRDRYNNRKPPRLDPKLVHANNAFSIRLFKQVDRRAGTANTLISPYSISTALAILYNGAGGDTRESLARALGFEGATLDQVNQSAAALRDVLEAPESGIRVRMASGLWVRSGRVFTDDFMIRIARFFRADACDIDFANSGASDEINDWAATRTRDKIDYLFADDDISSSAAVLANVIWFRGRWQRGFDPVHTQDVSFSPASGDPVKRKMMRHTFAFPFFRAEGVTGVSVPYGKGNTSFYAFLPDQGRSVEELVAKLNPGRWYEWMGRLKANSDAVTVTIPKVNLTEESVLDDPLSELGMGSAFSGRADFRPMGVGDGGIDQLKHKAALEIVESGAPVVPMSIKRGMEVEKVTLNRPFLCAIRDNRTGAILYLGVIRNLPGNSVTR